MNGLLDEEYAQIRAELDASARPLFFYHDDPDGLSSYLLLSRYKGEGKGIIIKSTPVLSEQFVRKVDEYSPDTIFVLDIAHIDPEFLQKVKTKIVMIDHHEPQSYPRVLYFNPRKHSADANIPTACLCYNAIKDHTPHDDLWIAYIGMVGDWFLPKDIPAFCEKYPALLDPKVSRPQDALFASKLGELIMLFSFLLKGKTKDVYTAISVLKKIKHPSEILEQTTAQGKFIFRKAHQKQKMFDELLSAARAKPVTDHILEFLYTESTMSYTKELANKLLYEFPDAVILVGRIKSGEVKMSLRSSGALQLPPMLNAALADVEGYGGGHEYACGACVKEEDYERFRDNLKKQIFKNI